MHRFKRFGERMQPVRARRWLLGSLLTMLAPAVHASYACEGPVYGVHVNGGGVLSVESMPGGSWLYLCQVDVPTNGVSADACKGVYTLFLTAQTTGRRVRIWFSDDGYNCTNHPSWSWLANWYWGPELLD
jgi:hypothetical protein